MKKIAAAFLFLSLIVCALSACSGGGNESSGEASTGSVPSGSVPSDSVPSGSVPSDSVSAGETSVGGERTPDMAALSQRLKGAFTAADVREFSADEIYDDTGIDAKDCEAFFWLAETSGLSSEKAVVFLAKDEAKAAEIKGRLGAVLQSELAQMKDYNADNYAMLQKAAAGGRGRCVWLLVSPAVDSFAAIVDGAF